MRRRSYVLTPLGVAAGRGTCGWMTWAAVAVVQATDAPAGDPRVGFHAFQKIGLERYQPEANWRTRLTGGRIGKAGAPPAWRGARPLAGASPPPLPHTAGPPSG